jgi:hypothetical protein
MGVIVLSVVILTAVMLNVVMLSVVILNDISVVMGVKKLYNIETLYGQCFKIN